MRTYIWEMIELGDIVRFYILVKHHMCSLKDILWERKKTTLLKWIYFYHIFAQALKMEINLRKKRIHEIKIAAGNTHKDIVNK